MKRWLVLLAVACSCARPAPPPAPHRAFYLWRTTLRLSPAELRALAELKIDRLYLRLFDLDWPDGDDRPRMLGPLVIEDADVAKLPPALELTPVVFLRARVLAHLDEARTRALASDMWQAVERAMARLGRPARELQIDCDWTAGERAAFFALLTALDQQARPHAVSLAATIRLHQVKYRERTGVPPVARGMLMFYNMGNVDADPAAHAIFDGARAESYLARLSDYPLPLDVALPIWSWVVHVRAGGVEGLLQDTDPAELAEKPWLRRAGPDRYEVTEPAFLRGTLLRRGDFLDVEQTTPAVLAGAAAQLAPRLAPARERRTVALFHLSETNLARHDTSTLVRVYDRFR